RRIYAFIQPQRRPDRLTQLRLEHVAGPVLYRVKYPRGRVRVVFVPISQCCVTDATTALERKRALYWANQARNERIAVFARAIALPDNAVLSRCGFRDSDLRPAYQKPHHRVAVLVETLEHGRQILALLPRWALLVAAPATPTTIDNETHDVTKNRTRR